MGGTGREIFSFEGFTLDLTRGCLRKGDREIEKLRPKSFALLRYLVGNPGRLVSKDELVNALWPNVIVSDDSLTQCISEVRDALDDHDRCIIKTIPRRGYRFETPISVQPPPFQPADALLPSHSGAVPAAPSRPGLELANSFDNRPAIAVLPFANVSGDPDQQHLVDGITDEIITELASWRSFPVIARGSTFVFKDRDVDIQSVAKQLGAPYIVEGSVAKKGQHVKITAKLIDGTTGHCLSVERYEPNIDELSDIEDEIVQAIVGSIAPDVVKVESERLERRRPPNPTSYEYFMRGLAFHYRYTKEHNAEAQRLFRKAIEADPKNAQAHALLAHAMVYAVQHRWCEDDDHNFEIADKLAAHATALDRRAPFAHFALGSTSMFLGRTEQALAEIQEAVRVNPSHAAAHAVMAHLLCYMGRPAEGLQSIERALRLSPHDPRLGIWMPAMAQAYYFLERYEDAIAAARRALALTPGNVIATRFLAAGLGQLGRIAEATPALAFLQDSREPTLADQKDRMEPIYRAPGMVSQVLAGLQKAGLT